MNELRLSNAIFDQKTILQGAGRFRELCTIRMIPDGAYTVCVFTDCVYDPEITMREFENYLIDAENAGI